MIVTQHAIARYIERIDAGLSEQDARAAILVSEPAVEAAAKFGAHVVRQGCGAKLILQGATVVTVIRRDRPWSGHSTQVAA